MSSVRVESLALVFLASIFLVGIATAYTLNNDFGRFEVMKVTIPDGAQEISGLLYRPETATSNNPLPAVVLVHGISSAKESMSGIALELARREIVALTIDIVGHGESGGQLGSTGDLSLGTLASIRYLKAQTYVNASSLGLAGHSLGGGAIRAAVAAEVSIEAIVLIAGGLGEMVADPAYGVLNSTFPRNLMIAIGRQDVLFELSQVTREWLPPVFGVSQEVVPGRLYGDFYLETARKLVTPPTTHLLEPLDPTIVSETVDWFNNALRPENTRQSQQLEGSFIYLYREAAMLVSVFAFVSLLLPISAHVFGSESRKNKWLQARYGFLAEWKTLIIWGALGIGLFLPMSFIGFIVPFPPVLFGSSIAWWLLAVGIVGLLFILFMAKFFRIKLKIGTLTAGFFNWRGVFVSIGCFVLLYLIIYLMDLFLGMNLWVFVPIFRVLRPMARIPLFFMFIPFFLVFFFVEGIYLHTLDKPSEKTGFLLEFLDMGKTIIVKIVPYLAVMCIQYLPMFLLEVRPLPSLVGFLIEFFPLITLQFVISTTCSWWFYRITSSAGTGAILNAFLFAWISAGAFPFGVFR